MKTKYKEPKRKKKSACEPFVLSAIVNQNSTISCSNTVAGTEHKRPCAGFSELQRTSPVSGYNEHLFADFRKKLLSNADIFNLPLKRHQVCKLDTFMAKSDPG